MLKILQICLRIQLHQNCDESTLYRHPHVPWWTVHAPQILIVRLLYRQWRSILLAHQEWYHHPYTTNNSTQAARQEQRGTGKSLYQPNQGDILETDFSIWTMLLSISLQFSTSRWLIRVCSSGCPKTLKPYCSYNFHSNFIFFQSTHVSFLKYLNKMQKNTILDVFT